MVLLEEVLDISTKLLNSSSEQQVIDIERLSAAGSDAWPALPVLLHITLRGGNRAVQLQALKLLERGTIGGSTIVATLAAALLRVESEGREFGMVPALACHSERLHFVRDTLV